MGDEAVQGTAKDRGILAGSNTGSLPSQYIATQLARMFSSLGVTRWVNASLSKISAQLRGPGAHTRSIRPNECLITPASQAAFSLYSETQ